jgi:hypothetical protein
MARMRPAHLLALLVGLLPAVGCKYVTEVNVDCGDAGAGAGGSATTHDAGSKTRGAFFLNHSAANAGCNIFDFTAQVGALSKDQITTMVADGEDGAVVSCNQIGVLRGVVDDTEGTTGTRLEVDVELADSMPTKDKPTNGAAIYSSIIKTAGEPFFGKCSFWLEGSESVGNGKAWMSFSCATANSAQTSCSVQAGTFAFENCW